MLHTISSFNTTCSLHCDCIVILSAVRYSILLLYSISMEKITLWMNTDTPFFYSHSSITFYSLFHVLSGVLKLYSLPHALVNPNAMYVTIKYLLVTQQHCINSYSASHDS